MADTELEIVVWSVEHGSAIFVKTPNGRTIALDAGRSTEFSPAKWLKSAYSLERIDLFCLSHADTDHIRDVQNLDELLSPHVFSRNKEVPRDLVYPTYPPEKEPLRYFHQFDQRYCQPLPEGSPYRFAPSSNWGDVTIRTFYCSYPEYAFGKLNDYSMAVFLLYGNLEFLFPGDLEAPGWEALMKNGDFVKCSTPSSTNQSEIRILVAAHHGRSAGVYKPFLDLYQPHLTIMSDKYGVEYTDDDSYRAASLGYPVYSRDKKETETRYVLTTKVNNFVLIIAAKSAVAVNV